MCLPLRDRHGMNIQRGPARNILRERRGERFLADGSGHPRHERYRYRIEGDRARLELPDRTGKVWQTIGVALEFYCVGAITRYSTRCVTRDAMLDLDFAAQLSDPGPARADVGVLRRLYNAPSLNRPLHMR